MSDRSDIAIDNVTISEGNCPGKTFRTIIMIITIIMVMMMMIIIIIMRMIMIMKITVFD